MQDRQNDTAQGDSLRNSQLAESAVRVPGYADAQTSWVTIGSASGRERGQRKVSTVGGGRRNGGVLLCPVVQHPLDRSLHRLLFTDRPHY